MGEIRQAGLPSVFWLDGSCGECESLGCAQVATLPVTERQHQSARGPVTVAGSAGS